MQAEIITRIYTAQEVAAVVGTTAKNMANWADRGLIVPRNTDEIGRGRHREYSWNTLMQIACATVIMDLGFTSPKDAFETAAHFAHVGRSQGGCDRDLPEGAQVRRPGLPFHHMRGITMMYVAGQHSAILLHRIWNKEPFSDGYFQLREELRDSRGHVALDLTEIFKEVCRRLQVDYRIVLDEAYRGQDEAVNWQRPGQGG